MCDVLKSEPMAMAGRLQPWRTAHKKDRVLDVMLLTQFREKHRANCISSRRIKPDVEQAVGVGIDGNGQPISLIIELNHDFINYNVIRVSTIRRL